MSLKRTLSEFYGVLFFLMIFLGTILTVLQVTDDCNQKYPNLDAYKDAYVSEAQPDENFGNTVALNLGNRSNNNFRSYFSFNTKDYSGAVRMIFYGSFDSSIAPFYVEIFLVDEPWNETTITWNNQPELGESIGRFKITYILEEVNFHYILRNRNDFSICMVMDYDNGPTNPVSIASHTSSGTRLHIIFCPPKIIPLSIYGGPTLGLVVLWYYIWRIQKQNLRKKASKWPTE